MSRALVGMPVPLLVGEAFEALADNRLRSALSLLGVAIGIASIIVVSSIASAGRDMVFQELETFGLRTFWVFRTLGADDRLEKDAVGSGITTTDFHELQRRALPAVSKLSPVVESGEGTVAAKNGKTVRVRLQGVSHEFGDIDGDELVSGRFLSPQDVASRANVAVIGPGVVQRLFASGSPLGQRFTLDEHWFVVVGVLQEKSRDLISSLGAARGEETNARILVPYTTRQRMLSDSDYVSYLQGQATALNRSDEALGTVMDILSARHRQAFRYKGESMAAYIATANRILGGVALIGVVAAVVSLLVGGLAIMNIMFTSVVERTREIGLRRAIGATRRAIQAQFVTEAVLISLVGGLLGLVLGLALLQVLALFTALHAGVSAPGLILALASTFVVGVASGYYPALSASRLAPVEALRHD